MASLRWLVVGDGCGLHHVSPAGWPKLLPLVCLFQCTFQASVKVTWIFIMWPSPGPVWKGLPKDMHAQRRDSLGAIYVTIDSGQVVFHWSETYWVPTLSQILRLARRIKWQRNWEELWRLERLWLSAKREELKPLSKLLDETIRVCMYTCKKKKACGII